MISEGSYENNDNGLHSQSYNGSTKRNVESFLKSNLIKIAPKLVEKRRRFWQNFFNKHSENISEEPSVNDLVLESSTTECLYKPLSHIQHWVETGYFPYNKKQHNMDEDEQSDTCSVSEPQNNFKIPQHVVKEKASERPNLNDNFSSSSVDTTAYILSNTNVTKKAETMAIVEGAKSNAIVSSQNVQSISTIRDNMHENIPDKICEQTNKNIGFNDNGGDSQQSSAQNNGIERNIIQAETNLDADVSQSTLSNDDNSLSKSYYNKLIYGRLTQTLKSPYRKHSAERNSLNMSLSYRTQNFTPPSKLIKTGNRKKLYTGRDSPVDLVNMNSCNRNSLTKARYSSHPALDFGFKLSKSYKVKKLNRIRCFSLFNNSSDLFKQPRRRKKKPLPKKIRTNSMNSSKTDASAVNSNSIKDSKVDKHVERNLVQDLDESISNNVSKENKFKSTTHLEKTNGSKELTDLIPVVRLIKLSEDEIKKYTSSSEAIDDDLNITTLLREHRKRKRKFGRIRKISRPKTLSVSTETNSIQSYKNSYNAAANLNPVVCLERLSESEIQKYKGSDNKDNNKDNFQSPVHITRLSISNVKKSKNINDEKVLRKDILSDTIKSEQENMFKDKLLRYNKSLNLPIPSMGVINVTTEDSASDSSTLLFYKCDKTKQNKYRLSNESVKPRVDNQPDFIQPSTKRITRRQSDKLEQEISKVTNEQILKIEQNGKLKRSETKAKNQTTWKENEEISKVKTRSRCRSQPGRDVSISSIRSHGYETRSRKSEELRSSTNSDDLLSMENMNRIKNSLTAPWRLEMICRSSSSSSSSSVDRINKNNCKEVSHNLFSSDEDDFVKFVHCPEDVGKKELKQRYKMLTQEFNNPGEQQDNDNLRTVYKSPYNKSKFITKSTIIGEKNFVRRKDNRFSNNSEADYREKTESVNKSRPKVLVVLDTTVSHSKTQTRLHFKTKLFESDSESSEMSHSSSNKFLLRDEE